MIPRYLYWSYWYSLNLYYLLSVSIISFQGDTMVSWKVWWHTRLSGQESAQTGAVCWPAPVSSEIDNRHGAHRHQPCLSWLFSHLGRQCGCQSCSLFALEWQEGHRGGKKSSKWRLNPFNSLSSSFASSLWIHSFTLPFQTTPFLKRSWYLSQGSIFPKPLPSW